MQRPIDFAPLIEPVDRDQLTAFRRATQRRPGTASATRVVATVIAAVCVAFFAGASLFLAFGAFAVARDGDPFAFSGLLLPLVLLGVVLVLALRPRVNAWERRYRLHRFAQRNGLRYEPHSPDPAYPGVIFQLGRSRHARDHVRSLEGRYLDYGNFRYTTGSGKNRRVHDWGFLAMRLERTLPHMVLDARANDGLLGTNLPMAFARDQRLSLEGDFDRHFTLYCPREYERDALTVFTPDLMALLIDQAAPFDVEIVDAWMFVYSPKPFDMADPALHRRILHIVDTVGAKALRQTTRYRDERIGDPAVDIVAPAGARLRRGVSVATLAVGAVIVAVWLLPTVLRML